MLYLQAVCRDGARRQINRLEVPRGIGLGNVPSNSYDPREVRSTLEAEVHSRLQNMHLSGSPVGRATVTADHPAHVISKEPRDSKERRDEDRPREADRPVHPG